MIDLRFPSKLVLTIAACAVFTFSGCKSSTEKAADKNLNDMKSANSDTATTSAGKDTLPPACDAYITKVDSCVKSMGGNNPAAAQFKQTMEQTRSSWANIQDKAQLANMCKQANDSFTQMSAAMCK